MHDPSDLDEDIWSFPLSSWAYYHKLHQMEWTVQMGFELDIYQPDELAGMYWYYCLPSSFKLDQPNMYKSRYLTHLIQTRLLHLQRIRTFTTYRFSLLQHPTLTQRTSFTRSFSFLDFANLEASATVSFAYGLQCVCPLSLPIHLPITPPTALHLPAF